MEKTEDKEELALQLKLERDKTYAWKHKYRHIARVLAHVLWNDASAQAKLLSLGMSMMRPWPRERAMTDACKEVEAYHLEILDELGCDIRPEIEAQSHG